jgi:hypothetical protein
LLRKRTDTGIVVAQLTCGITFDELGDPHDIRVADAELVVRAVAADDDVLGQTPSVILG